MSGNNIKVICRFRPQNSREISEGGNVIVRFDDNGETVYFDGNEYNGNFTFDRAFSPDTTQEAVFNYSVKSTVDDVLKGYNGTVFAYGQTGSGKTFTMMGADIDNSELKGIIPRITEQIFSSILESPENIEFTVKVSYMEIYMEKIRDLLNPSNDNLPIHEEKSRGVYVKGLLEVYVSSVNEVYEVMRRGGAARVVAYTNMNAESSRSHSIFVVTISQKNVADGSIKSGKLYLVDLAGSEKVGKTGASGQTLEEAKKINKSLTALGMVINSLTDGKSTHVPYRDSKLTRILQESLGGNSRTTLIINSSPSSFNEAESLSTMRFGMRAKNIKNKAKINQDLSPAELKALLKKAEQRTVTFQAYISALEGEVQIWRSGGNVPPEKYVTPDQFGAADQTPSGTTPPSSNNDITAVSAASTTRTADSNGVNEDEKEDWLKRENELVDEISTKESELEKQRVLTDTLNSELEILKQREGQLFEENKDLTSSIHELKLQLEKVSYESKENQINLDDLKERNKELETQMEDLKKTITEMEHAKKASEEGDKERRKQEKMAQMMAELDPNNVISEKEKQVRSSLHSLLSASLDSLSAGDRKAILKELSDAKNVVDQMQDKMKIVSTENEMLLKKKEELESKITSLELEYEELLDKTIQEEEQRLTGDSGTEHLQELKSKLESQYASKRDAQQQEIADLKSEIQKKHDEMISLTSEKTEMKKRLEDLTREAASALSKVNNSSKPESEKDKDLEKIKKTMAAQLSEFDTMKKALMRDLQNRCEKVVELELSLDEIREQYNNMLKNNNIKATQKKMAFLERNLEQLTSVQKQLVEQNTTLKKDIAIAERKLIARNERIQHLEDMLQETQANLASQKQSFESKLSELRQRLRDSSTTPTQPSSEWSWGRVAKPLRGGGTNVTVVDDTEGSTNDENVIVNNDVARVASANQNKRSSWLGFMNMGAPRKI
ncbi:kinesin heavy chain [Paraphysoderma sedebokerense]|nr:kinesin heavy chain [Paraphysoderma sedebokerense]